MTAIAWVILMWLTLEYKDVKLSDGDNNGLLICLFAIVILTIKDLFK